MHVIFLELLVKNNKISKDFSLFAIAIPQKVSNPGRNDSVTQVLELWDCVTVVREFTYFTSWDTPNSSRKAESILHPIAHSILEAAHNKKEAIVGP